MKNQAYRMTMLYDFYGDLLTERQREFFDLYYTNDLSLAEIAENFGITRQGVRDVIVRAERVLEEMEEKTGIIRRYRERFPSVKTVQDSLEEIATINRRQYDDERIRVLCERALGAIEGLKE